MKEEDILKQIEGNMYSYLESSRQAYKPSSNTATNLSIPCVRFGVFSRTHWDKKALPEPESRLIMDDGKALEEETIRLLRDMGFKVEETQRPYRWEKYNIGGKIDGKLVINGQKGIPIEIYTMDQFAFKSVNTWEDVKNAKSIWLKKKGYQLQVYLLMGNHDWGILVLRTYRRIPKFIFVPLDLDIAEQMVGRAEAINNHIALGTNADPIPWDDQLCGYCPFLHVCMPDRHVEPTVIDDPDIEVKLNRRGELEESYKEYKEIDEELKERFENIPEAIIGNWRIAGREVQRKAYSVKEGSYWRTQIEKLK